MNIKFDLNELPNNVHSAYRELKTKAEDFIRKENLDNVSEVRYDFGGGQHISFNFQGFENIGGSIKINHELS